MKCLENLSLVDDECLDDLQKDIAKIIESYIKIEDCCSETFKKLKDSLLVYQIKEIVSILNDTDTFWGMPMRLKGKYWEKDLSKFVCFESQEDIEDSLKDIMHMFREFSLNDARDFDFKADAFWIYRDGANGALHMEREDDFLDSIEEQIPYEWKETQLEILKVLKRIERNR